MKKLIEYTKILRSKNAGPLFVTFDLIFEDREKMEYVLKKLTKLDISKAYSVKEEEIDIISYPVVNSIKITFPRAVISGGILDTDVYGAQMHMPLSNIEI